MKKFSIVFIVATAVQSSNLSGMNYLKKLLFLGSKEKTTTVAKETTSKPVKELDNFPKEQEYQDENEMLGSFILLGEENEKPNESRENVNKSPLLTTVYKDVTKKKQLRKRNRKKKKKKLTFHLSGPSFYKRLDLKDFERLYGIENKK